MTTTARTLLARGMALFLLIFVMLLVGCAPITKPVRPTPTADVIPTTSAVASPAVSPGASTASPVAPATATAAATPTVGATMTVAPSATPNPPTPTPTAQNTPRPEPAVLIKAVVQKANEDQARAFNQHNPALMKDTATSTYYDHLLQVNDDLTSSGVAAIKLLKLEWGPITLRDATSAEATTYETWETEFSEGGIEQDRAQNVYQLVLENGAWKIQSDDHPSSGGPGGIASPSGTPTPGAMPTPPEQIIPAGPGESRNWSGYAADKGTFSAVSGTWTIPHPTTTGVTASAATWVGIGGVQYHDLIQAGTEEIVLGQDSVRYNAWIEMLPDVSHVVPLIVHPGDSISVSITYHSGNEWLITIRDNTTGESFKKTVTYKSSQSSAEWIEEAPSGGRRIVPLEKFGKLTVTNAMAVQNGKPVTAAKAGGKPVTMIDARGDVIAQTSPLGSDGSSFSVTRVGPDPSPLTSPGGRFDRPRHARGIQTRIAAGPRLAQE